MSFPHRISASWSSAAFEERFINQGYDENRTIDQTLDLGWELLSMLPESELDRVDEDVLKEHYKPAQQ